MSETLTETEFESTIQPSKTRFLYISTERYLISSIISMGLYERYWIYKNWSYIQNRDRLDIMPFWRGVFGIFFIHSLLKQLENDPELSQLKTASFSSASLATPWVILTIIGNAASRSEQPMLLLVGFGVSLLSLFCLLPVQRYINEANEMADVMPEESKWSGGQILCIIVGGIIWAAFVIGFVGGLAEAL